MAEQVQDNNKFTGVRLPESFVATHYDLSLKPDLKGFTFEGNVSIRYSLKGDAADPSAPVVLHAAELAITEGHAEAQGERLPLKRVTYSKDTETASLDFAGGLLPKAGTIFLKFNGTLNDRMKGFYRSEFKLDGKSVHAATTQFEATDARRCFPCCDEPAAKATFAVTMTYQQPQDGPKMIALSNTPEISNSVRGDAVEVKFAETPKMSTYLLAFVVGPFEYIEGTDGRRKIRVYTTPGKQEQGRFALEVACKSLPYYEDYFKIDFPLPKMDLIAVPDFAFGAMENWGLITYRETTLLFNPDETSTDAKQHIAVVVAHELAHQWFGNLVTMEWWTHLWLNEGFASFMQYLCVDSIFPEYDVWSQFLTGAYKPAMDLDSLHSSHPIEVPVGSASEINEIFDDISYSKGASVIRMLHHFIGDDSFRKGMHSYLTKFAYQNARTEDLWASLEEASNKPVCKLMSGWTSRKGYPWLSVSQSTEGADAKLSLTQSKFTADGHVPSEEKGAIWVIPVSAASGAHPGKPAKTELIEGRSGQITVEGAGDSWVKLNPGTIGLYRTAYSEEMARKLWPAIRDQSLPAMDRLGLQDDFFALCRAGKVATVDYLRLLEAFKGETDYTVWRSIDSSMGRLSILLANTDYQDKFHAFGRALYAELWSKLTWSPRPSEKHTDALLRTMVVNRLVSFNEPSVVEEAKRRFRAQVDKKEMVAADLRGAVYRAVSVYGDDRAFESLFEIHRTAELHEEKNRVALAMGSAMDGRRLMRVIEFTLSSAVRNQDKVMVFLPLGASNPSVAWKMLQDHKDVLRDIYGNTNLVNRLVKYTTENFSSQAKALEVEKFFEENPFPGAERSVQQSLENIRLNANWLARDSEGIQALLQSNAGVT